MIEKIPEIQVFYFLVAKDKIPVLIYPWEISATKCFLPEEMLGLKKSSVGNLAKKFGKNPHSICYALAELWQHGNPRKGAQLARSLVEQDPRIEQLITKRLGSAGEYLLQTRLDCIPSCPGDYPSSIIRLEFIH